MRTHRSTNKATHGQLRRHNQQLLLRAIYEGVADNRAALAQETDLAKPTVSELIGELMDAGLLVEEGRGQSTSGGGKRPRLLKFVPTARHVIGLAINDEYAMGALSFLDGEIIARHYVDLAGAQGEAVIETLKEVINGLLAQLDAPLLCIGVGVPGVVDTQAGVVDYAPYLDWRQVPLARILSAHYDIPVYIANSTALVAMAQFVYGPTEAVSSFATVRVGGSVGVGLVINGTIYHGGGEIGHLRIADQSPVEAPPDRAGRLETFLSWTYVKRRACALRARYPGSMLPGDNEPLTYLHIRHAVAHEDPAALVLQAELSHSLAQVFAWIIGLFRPNHISLAGPITDLGESLLAQTVEQTRQLVLPDLGQAVTFSLTDASNLVTMGAIAQALHMELGLV